MVELEAQYLSAGGNHMDARVVKEDQNGQMGEKDSGGGARQAQNPHPDGDDSESELLKVQYQSAGGNDFDSGADWDESGILAFGSGNNIALWHPHDLKSKGVYTILRGHTDRVNVVKFLPRSKGVLISGGADHSIRIWTMNDVSPRGWKSAPDQTLAKPQENLQKNPPKKDIKKDPGNDIENKPKEGPERVNEGVTIIGEINAPYHRGSINCITAVGTNNIFASGSADGTVKIWVLDNHYRAHLQQTIVIEPTFIPRALALSPLTGAPKSCVLAVAGTTRIIQVYVLDFVPEKLPASNFQLCAILKGHEDWIRSLDFTRETDQPFSDIILASGSQDKHIRLWRIHQGHDLPLTIAAANASPSVISPLSQHSDLVGRKRNLPSTKSSYSEHGNKSLTSSSYSSYKLNSASLASLVSGESEYKAYRPEHVEYEANNSPYRVLAPGLLRSNTADSTTTILEEPEELRTAASSLYTASASVQSLLEKPTRNGTAYSTMSSRTLSNKAYRFKAQGLTFSLTFEALLLGHEDWVPSVKWCFTGANLQLLSASCDNSLAIWEPDPATGVWITITRLGEISVEKGSTTATGSTGGFYTGLWSPSGESVACIGTPGSWRVWHHNPRLERWTQSIGISGHTDSVTSIAWQERGEYLLSAGLDKSTRLHAPWKRGQLQSWHEMARPQIHGYNQYCIDTLGTSEFVAGAEEHALRVFREPVAVARLYRKLGGFEKPFLSDTPAAANVPVLGLSNKAIEEVSDGEDDDSFEHEPVDTASVIQKSMFDIEHPPLEDHLSRYTLWPEGVKLYGHGTHISAIACSHDGTLIATACQATSIDHAVIILFRTDTWQRTKTPLVAHKLTIYRLRFSAGDQYLLSVGRDRQWTVFERNSEDPDEYIKAFSKPAAHRRHILDGAWAPSTRLLFATCGADQEVKIWAQQRIGTGDINCVYSRARQHSLTAVHFYDRAWEDNYSYLLVGEASGMFYLYSVSVGTGENEWSLQNIPAIMLANKYPSRAINQVAWRPSFEDETTGKLVMEFALASADHSVRIYRLRGCPRCLHDTFLFQSCCGAPKKSDDSSNDDKRKPQQPEASPDPNVEQGLGIRGVQLESKWSTEHVQR